MQWVIRQYTFLYFYCLKFSYIKILLPITTWNMVIYIHMPNLSYLWHIRHWCIFYLALSLATVLLALFSLYIWLCCSNRWAYFLLVSYYRLEMGFVDDLSMFSVRHCLVTYVCWASSLLFLRKTDIERWIFLHMFFRSVLLFLVSTVLNTFVILQCHFFSASFKITILVPKYDSPQC